MSSDQQSSRLPSLDGLRAAAIALVMLEHLGGTQGFPLDRHAFGRLGDIGYVGVRAFFVLSGFLITSLLLKEHARTGTIAVGAFYVRRAFRILPAFLAFVAVISIAVALGQLQVREGDVRSALTYTMNYHYVRSWELGHIWSLSVEEQFYLLWPVVVFALGPRRLGYFALAALATAPVMRVLAWYLAPHRDDVIAEAFPCVMDSIATGSLLAVYRSRLDEVRWYQSFLRSPAFAVVPLLVVAANVETRVWINYVVDPSLQNVLFALIVDRVVRVREGLAYRLLNARAMVWVGTISYSLYLWQEPFLNPRSHRGFAAWPLNVTLAFACAIASYYLVERPFFGLRAAWERRRAASAAALDGAT